MTEPLYDIEEFKKHCLALVDMIPHAVSARHLTHDTGGLHHRSPAPYCRSGRVELRSRFPWH